MPDDPAMLWLCIGVMAVLFLLNLLLSCAHLALVATSDAQLAKLADDGDKKAKAAMKLLKNPTRFSEAMRLWNVLLGFAFALAAVGAVSPTFLCERFLEIVWEKAFPPPPLNVAVAVVATVTVLVSAVVWLLFSEWLPRRAVAPKAQAVAFALLGFLKAAVYLITPLQWMMTVAADVLSRLFGVDPSAADEQVTEEEIRLLVDVGEEKGVIEGSQKEMINNIFEFDDLTAADIMTPRTDVEAIDAEDSIDDALHAAVSNGVSRLPVYEEDIDHVIGVLYIKDLLPYVGKALPEVVTVRSMMREPLFVPETKKCGELFSEMTAAHMQMAMIVDEYGGIAGIVTMEDLLESIVGNMQDEYDNEQEEVTKLDENRYAVDGTTDIDEVSELIDIELPEGDYDTLGGFLMSKLGRIPDTDEHPQVTFENAVFTVQAMDDRRIESVHIEVLPKPQEEDDE